MRLPNLDDCDDSKLVELGKSDTRLAAKNQQAVESRLRPDPGLLGFMRSLFDRLQHSTAVEAC